MSLPQESLSKIRACFQSAEVAIKDCENLTGNLPQGAVNELRYSCRHLIEFLEDGSEENLNKFIRHCKRAEYDSKELQVLMLKEKVQHILESFRSNEDVVMELLGESKYIKMLNSKKQTDEILVKASAEVDKRIDYLTKIQGAIPLLQDDLTTLSHSLPAIRRKIKKQNYIKNITNFGIFLAVLAVIAGFLAL